jgi:hypothetical protein
VATSEHGVKMKKVSVTWERSVTVPVYAPVDMADEDIRNAATDTADTIDREAWDVADWQTSVGHTREVEVPDAECAMELAAPGRWLRVAEGSRLRGEGVMVMDDTRAEIVNPEDAMWWLAPVEDVDMP